MFSIILPLNGLFISYIYHNAKNEQNSGFIFSQSQTFTTEFILGSHESVNVYNTRILSKDANVFGINFVFDLIFVTYFQLLYNKKVWKSCDWCNHLHNV